MTGVFVDGVPRDLSGAGYGTEYASADPAIATVDPSGEISARSVGTTTVTVSNGAFTDDVAVTVISAPPDSDGDLVYDAEDNCVFQANSDQLDLGGVATVSDPNGEERDGIGDVCQCGDVTGDGRVNQDDSSLLSDALAGTAALTDASLCNVAADAGDPLGLCSDADLAALSAVPPAAIQQLCAPALGFDDSDADGVADVSTPGVPEDNCALVRNEFQEDRNLDGAGDACTASCDLNVDGLVDGVDVLLAVRITAGDLAAPADMLGRADVAPASGGPTDQEVNGADVLLIQRAAAGEAIPVCTPAP